MTILTSYGKFLFSSTEVHYYNDTVFSPSIQARLFHYWNDISDNLGYFRYGNTPLFKPYYKREVGRLLRHKKAYYISKYTSINIKLKITTVTVHVTKMVDVLE
jgi:hypothetical protein